MSHPLLKTQTNTDTGMKHILHVSIHDTLYQSYCGYRTHKEDDGTPDEEPLDLDGDGVCSTCVKIFTKEELDGDITNLTDYCHDNDIPLVDPDTTAEADADANPTPEP